MYSEKQLIEILNRLRVMPSETEIVEFKRAENSFSDSDLGQYFSALSNEANLKGAECGWLVFGVDNKTHELTNSQYKSCRPALDEMKKKIGDQTTNRITFDEIYAFKCEGKRVVMFQIPAAPRGIPIAYQGHYYGRDGESLVALNLHEIELIRAQADGTPCFELQAAKTGLSVDDVLALLNYKKLYELIDKRVPKDENTIIELMKEYGFVGNDGNCLAVTNVGALLLANRLADFDQLKTRQVIVRKYDGLNNRVLIVEKRTESGYAVEFDDLLEWICDNSSKEKIIGRREREAVYPKVAIREFLANLMVHQDLKVSGMQLTVEIFANRMVFTNPGCSLNDVQRLIDLPPRSRNEELAGALLLFDICERRGSGYDRAVAAIEKMKLPPYKTESGVDFTRVTLYPWKDVSEMNKAERVQACYQHVCLMYEDGISVNNGSIRERFGLDKNKSAMASHIISDTLDANLIKVENPESDSRRYATYLPFYA